MSKLLFRSSSAQRFFTIDRRHITMATLNAPLDFVNETSDVWLERENCSLSCLYVALIMFEASPGFMLEAEGTVEAERIERGPYANNNCLCCQIWL